MINAKVFSRQHHLAPIVRRPSLGFLSCPIVPLNRSLNRQWVICSIAPMIEFCLENAETVAFYALSKRVRRK